MPGKHHKDLSFAKKQFIKRSGVNFDAYKKTVAITGHNNNGVPN